MKKPQVNRQKMAIAVALKMKQNCNLWQHLPSMVNSVNTLNELLDTLTEWQLKQEYTTAIPGHSKNKRILRNRITEGLLRLGGALNCIAQQIKRFDICVVVDASATELNRLTQSDFLTMATTILQHAQPWQQQLQHDYNLDAAFLQSLSQDIETFSNTHADIKTIKAEIKLATDKIKLTVRDMMNFLRNTLDKNMQIFRGQPFFDAYMNCRNVDEYSAATTAIRGRLTDVSGAPVPHAKLCMYLGAEKRNIKVRKGSFCIKQMKGSYYVTLTASAKGFLPAEYMVNLRDGYTTQFNITLIDAPKQIATPQLAPTMVQV